MLNIRNLLSSCLDDIFKERSLDIKNIAMVAGNFFSLDVVFPIGLDSKKYKQEDKNIYRRYHEIGHENNYQNLEFFFRHYLSSIGFNFGIPFVKKNVKYNINGIDKPIKLHPRNIIYYFKNDRLYSAFFDYIFNSNQFGKTIKEIGMIYQNLKIKEEKEFQALAHLLRKINKATNPYQKNAAEREYSLKNKMKNISKHFEFGQIPYLIISCIFIMLDTLDKAGKLEILNIDFPDNNAVSETDIKTLTEFVATKYKDGYEYNDIVNDDNCKKIFEEGYDLLLQIKQDLLNIYPSIFGYEFAKE